MNAADGEHVREWARREAAKLPPFSEGELRQAAVLAREIDARAAEKARSGALGTPREDG